jgi:branched-chain amino acid transport system substrate-binding protein
MRMRIAAVVGLAGLLASGAASAQIKIGMTVSTTGPGAAIGTPMKNTVPLMPETIAGQKVEYIVLDDASDTTNARRNTEKLIAEHNVDVILGTSSTPGTLAMTEVAARAKTPVMGMGAGVVLIRPMDENKRWIFKMPYDDSIIARLVANHMAENGVKSVAVISFNDAYGESWLTEFEKVAKENKIPVVGVEKFNRTDTSVTAQVLKTIAARPDAVLVIASGTPAVLPQATLVERGYKGKIYQTSGVISNDFLRVGGKNVEGTLIPSGPVVVVDELPEGNPAKRVGVEFKQKYEALYGAGSMTTFAGNMWDAILVVEAAVPKALEKAKPGTEEFRVALRDAIENVQNVPATHGLITMSAENHNGFSVEAPVMITVKNGRWALAQ